jgi:hypothetical protein
MWRTLIAICTIAPILGGAYGLQAAPRQGPCAEIFATCQQAGFVRGGAKSGQGLLVDCVAPIMQDRPQPRRASKPLPPIDPQLVASCKAQYPTFGQRNRQSPPAAEPPADEPPAAPPRGAVSPVPSAATALR